MDSDSDSDDDLNDYALRPLAQMRTELHEHVATITGRTREIKRIESRLKYLKLKQRVTAAVRKDAVREPRATTWYQTSRTHDRGTSCEKGTTYPTNEAFTKSYLERQNFITRDLINDLNDDIRELRAANDRDAPRWDELYFAVYGRPRVVL